MAHPDPMRRITMIHKAKGVSEGYQVKIYLPNSPKKEYYSKFFKTLGEPSLSMAQLHRDDMERQLGIKPISRGTGPRKVFASSAFPGVQVKIEIRQKRLYAYVVGIVYFTDPDGKPRRHANAFNIIKLGYEKAYVMAVEARCKMAGFELPETLCIPPISTSKLEMLKQQGCDMSAISQPYEPHWIKS